MSKLINYLEDQIKNLQRNNDIQDKQIQLLANTRDIKDINYLQEILTKLEQNTFLDLFNDPCNHKPTELKITISPNYMNDFQAKSFIVDTLSPEFLKALENELKNSLTKKAVQLNNLLLSTAQYEPIPDNEYNNIPLKTYKNDDFKVGDKVKVTSCGDIYALTDEFDNALIHKMTQMINDEIIYTIKDINQKGIELCDGSKMTYRFPKQSLTLVESVSDQEYLQEE